MSDEVPVVATGTFNESAPAAPKISEAVPAEEPKKVDPFAPKFAALTRLDKEVKGKAAALAAERKAIEAEKAELAKWREERSKADTDYKAKLKENPLTFLQDHEVPFEDLVEMQLNDGKQTPEKLIMKMKAEMDSKYSKEIEELKSQLKKEREDEENQKLEQAKEGFKTQISKLITDNTDTYELVHLNQAQGLVYDVIETHYQETGRILKIEDAAKAVEEHLEEEVRRQLESKKFKQASPPSAAKTPTQTAPTLSNTMSSEVPVKGERKLSSEESLKEAAKLIRWNK